jgi:aminoglycoside phosphotransferase family enzyme/predicted kinase
MAGRPPAAPSDPQEHLLAFLSDGRSYGLPSAEVERITTHAAHVFLVGKNAYKMKRAVRYSFLDFTTLDRRRRTLEAELELNRRTAPVLYRRLVPVTRADGDRLALAGSGEPVEWLLEMARFDQEARLDHIAERGQLTPAIVDDLAAAIAAFHAKAAVRTVYGGYAGMREVIEGNAEDFAALPEAIFGAARTARLTGLCRDELVKQRDLLEERRRSGHVRHCHGDLHLGNIVLLDGRPVLFDCLEFDEALASTDILYDLAFLLMDLLHQERGALAQRLLNGYLDATWDDDGLALLPLFLACRAAIRAKVLGFGVARGADASAAGEVAAARDYLERALAYLSPPRARLVALGGVSGTGKSSLARQLAPELGPAPGAVVLRCGAQAFGRVPQGSLARGLRRTGGTRRRARPRRPCGDRGCGIPRSHGARAAERVAIDAGVPFQGLWLTAPAEILVQRVAARRGDVSDATPDVLRQQLATDPGPLTWALTDVSGSPEAVAGRARALLARPRPGRPFTGPGGPQQPEMSAAPRRAR